MQTMTNEANAALVREWLDIVANDSENLERTMQCMTDDCVWVMEPGGTEYHGAREIRAFVEIAMAGRTHDKGQHRLQITNWFADSEKSLLRVHARRRSDGQIHCWHQGADKDRRQPLLHHLPSARRKSRSGA